MAKALKDNPDKNFYFKIVAERLVTIRNELGLNQEKLAKQLNVTQIAISRLENGLGSAPEMFVKILQYYDSKDYNLEWIIREDNSSILKKKDIIFSFDFDRQQIKSEVKKVVKASGKLKKMLDKM